MPTYYLFSIDLEDVRLLIPQGANYRERVPVMTERVLTLLKSIDARITFFVVGQVARLYPSLIKEIIAEGHEIACHTDTHLPLDRHTPASFERDISNNLESLFKAGATHVDGFRAPTFSLTQKTEWAYKILNRVGITYSSSVLPENNPLYGWKEFGKTPRLIDGVLEMPITTSSLGPLKVPFAGGVYFRVLPLLLQKWLFARERADAVLGYLHPYDIDSEQERFMHPGIGGSKLYNLLMFINRSRALGKVEYLCSRYRVLPYREYVGQSSFLARVA
jgi:polysaccharide deacetylase family protein (PEP-CTERM system associated)